MPRPQTRPGAAKVSGRLPGWSAQADDPLSVRQFRSFDTKVTWHRDPRSRQGEQQWSEFHATSRTEHFLSSPWRGVNTGGGRKLQRWRRGAKNVTWVVQRGQVRGRPRGDGASLGRKKRVACGSCRELEGFWCETGKQAALYSLYVEMLTASKNEQRHSFYFADVKCLAVERTVNLNLRTRALFRGYLCNNKSHPSPRIYLSEAESVLLCIKKISYSLCWLNFLGSFICG